MTATAGPGAASSTTLYLLPRPSQLRKKFLFLLLVEESWPDERASSAIPRASVTCLSNSASIPDAIEGAAFMLLSSSSARAALATATAKVKAVLPTKIAILVAASAADLTTRTPCSDSVGGGGGGLGVSCALIRVFGTVAVSVFNTLAVLTSTEASTVFVIVLAVSAGDFASATIPSFTDVVFVHEDLVVSSAADVLIVLSVGVLTSDLSVSCLVVGMSSAAVEEIATAWGRLGCC
mmetsp:Transcript_37207/g.81482  ORF Transcript_37207/g.81482 Transcript_37207/m.81482 type:complete len:236 (+) Transcript_37207:501-1208(+)